MIEQYAFISELDCAAASVVPRCHEHAPEESGHAEGSKGRKVESGR